MKRILTPVLISLICAALLAGCASGGADGGAATPAPAPTLTLANPMVEAESTAAFSELGVTVGIPEGAEDIKLHIIGGTVAQAAFTLDGHAYTYRAARGEEDVSGVYTAFSSEETTLIIEFDSEPVSARIRTAEGGGALATWRQAEASYSLWTEDTVDRDALIDLIHDLAAQQTPPDDGADEPSAPIDYAADHAAADLDGDGAEERIAFTADPDAYASALTVTAEGGAEHTLAFGEGSGLPAIEYMSALWVTDLDPADGLREIILSGDYGSDDYITYVCRFDGAKLYLADCADGAGGMHPGIYGEFLSDENGVLTIGNHVDMLGSWWGSRPYMLSGGAFTFAPVPGSVWERTLDPDDPENWTGEYGPALEVASPLPVTLEEGGADTLPQGTKLIVTASDGLLNMRFVTEDGRRGAVSYDAPVTEENSWQRSIGGVDEGEYFREIPYAG